MAPAPAPAAPTGEDELGFIWPASGSLLAGFDEARNKGFDIGGKAGDAVLAAADGRVVYAGAGLRGYGNLIILKHNNTFLTAYAHNQALLVKGRSVRAQGPEDCRNGQHRCRSRQAAFRDSPPGKTGRSGAFSAIALTMVVDWQASPGEEAVQDLTEDESAALSETESRVIDMGADQHGERLDKALADRVPEFSRSYLRQLLEHGAVQLNGQPASSRSPRRSRPGIGWCWKCAPRWRARLSSLSPWRLKWCTKTIICWWSTSLRGWWCTRAWKLERYAAQWSDGEGCEVRADAACRDRSPARQGHQWPDGGCPVPAPPWMRWCT